jgi:hypothetical protein|tara:strand:- start:393 stop:830 length:438 start_codon:yes stop_codon:yes gene_type:complete
MIPGESLSPKQLTFCAFIANGDKQTDAYLKAYNTKKLSRKGASTEASKLMRQGKIKDHVEKLKADMAVSKSALMNRDREWILHEVTQVIKDDEARHSDRLRALEILAKIRGLYEDSSEDVVEHRSSEDIKKELKQKLSEYLGATD